MTVKRILRIVGSAALVLGVMQAAPLAANAAGEPCEWVGTWEVATGNTSPSQEGAWDVQTRNVVSARNGAAGCEVTRTVTYSESFHFNIGAPDCGVKPRTRKVGQATTGATLSISLDKYTDRAYLYFDADVVRVVATGPEVPLTVYREQVDTCDGTVVSSVQTATESGADMNIDARNCQVGLGYYPLLRAPGSKAQAFNTSCTNSNRGSAVSHSLVFQRTNCDATVDSDGGGEGDCAEFAAGRNPGDKADDVIAPPVDLPPVARPDAATTSRFHSVIVDVLANDYDPEGGALGVTSCTSPKVGSVQVKGNVVTFKPARYTWGTVTFSCTVADPAGQSATAPVTVTVRKK